jgi:hypothetical protein
LFLEIERLCHRNSPSDLDAGQKDMQGDLTYICLQAAGSYFTLGFWRKPITDIRQVRAADDEIARLARPLQHRFDKKGVSSALFLAFLDESLSRRLGSLSAVLILLLRLPRLRPWLASSLSGVPTRLRRWLTASRGPSLASGARSTCSASTWKAGLR